VVGGNPRQRISLIVTVLDEARTIEALLDSVALQTCPPDEVVVVDGGSRDGTWAILQNWSSRLTLTCLQAPGASIAQGRNLAIEKATGELLAVTDAGVRLEPDWLEHLLAGMRADVDVVSGFFKADPKTAFERAMGATVLPSLEDVNAEGFLPSSRSVLFRRTAWQAVGGYPTWLDYCEDLVFDLALKYAGQRFAFAGQAVAWFRPRGSLRAFFRQYYLYARGDGKANLWWQRHLIRYVTYAVAAVLVWRSRRGRVLLLLGGWVYTRQPYRRLSVQRAGLTPMLTVYAMSLVPVIRLVGDVAKMLGYPVGVAWRLRRAWTCRSSS
jgi:glycosyltransferase involved in cell wall biosynthesis